MQNLEWDNNRWLVDELEQTWFYKTEDLRLGFIIQYSDSYYQVAFVADNNYEDKRTKLVIANYNSIEGAKDYVESIYSNIIEKLCPAHQ